MFNIWINKCFKCFVLRHSNVFYIELFPDFHFCYQRTFQATDQRFEIEDDKANPKSYCKQLCKE